MSNFLDIQLNFPADNDSVKAAIANADSIRFFQNYAPGLPAENIIDMATLTAGQADALIVFLDALTFTIEQDVVNIVVTKDLKSFDLSTSFVRTTEDTSTLTEIAVGTPYLIRFDIPGFLENKSFEISAWYNDDFNPTEVADLETQIGIAIVAGNGKNFSIRNDVDCKVSFRKPDTVTAVYVINYDSENIIPA
jgi:hypothetical protein